MEPSPHVDGAARNGPSRERRWVATIVASFGWLSVGLLLTAALAALSIATEPIAKLDGVPYGPAEQRWVEATMPDEVQTMPPAPPGAQLESYGWARRAWFASSIDSGALCHLDAEGTPRLDIPCVSVYRVRAGWPITAFEGSYWYPSGQMGWIARSIAPPAPTGVERYWPYGVRWLGLATDGLLFGAGAWALSAVLLAARRRRRARRGLCVRCCHPRGRSSHCPECGDATPRPDSGGP